MKYPYTFSAKIAQFPIKYYFQNQWIWKYYFFSLVVCAPVFYSISRLGKLVIGYWLYLVPIMFLSAHLSVGIQQLGAYWTDDIWQY